MPGNSGYRLARPPPQQRVGKVPQFATRQSRRSCPIDILGGPEGFRKAMPAPVRPRDEAGPADPAMRDRRRKSPARKYQSAFIIRITLLIRRSGSILDESWRRRRGVITPQKRLPPRRAHAEQDRKQNDEGAPAILLSIYRR